MILTVDFRARRIGRFWPAVKLPRVSSGSTTYSGDAALGALDSATRGRRVCVIIHGYNSPDSAVDPAYDALIHQMGHSGLYDPSKTDSVYDSVLLVKWPGGWAGGYLAAELRAYGKFGIPGAGDRLRWILQRLAPEFIDFQAHSLGNGVVGDCLRKGDVTARNWIAAAAAIDNDAICLPKGRFLRAVRSLTGRMLVFHKRSDWALRGFEVMKFDRALGFTGPQGGMETPSNVLAIDANAWRSGHSAFRSQLEFYAAWRALVGPST